MPWCGPQAKGPGGVDLEDAALEVDEAGRGGLAGREADYGSLYYHHWVAALERLVTEKGLTAGNTPTGTPPMESRWYCPKTAEPGNLRAGLYSSVVGAVTNGAHAASPRRSHR